MVGTTYKILRHYRVKFPFIEAYDLFSETMILDTLSMKNFENYCYRNKEVTTLFEENKDRYEKKVLDYIAQHNQIKDNSNPNKGGRPIL